MVKALVVTGKRFGLREIAVAVLFCAALLAPAPFAKAAIFNVGPGQSHTNIGAVPWESLQAGDTVRIHWRTNSYKEKWVVCRQGSSNAPITITGVPGPAGQLPVIDGQNATTRSTLRFWNENRAVIKIGGASVPADTTPRFIVIENLDIRGARPPFAYTSPTGTAGSYINNAAAIYIEKGENIIVRNCVMHDCGNGFFVASGDELASRDILVEGNYIYDNGNDGSLFEHNNYTAAINIIFQYNRFGPLRPGCPGNNLKDRSAGLVVRYNWIESGNRQLDLVDGEDSSLIRAHPQYRTTLVYGNVLIEPDAAGNRQIAHYGGDSGTTANYRKGTLHFYNNTIISTRTDRTTLFRLSSNEENADCRNNIIYVTAAGNTLSMLDDTGRLNLTHNWTKPGWVSTFGTVGGSITNMSNITGASPAFLDETRQHFFLGTNSACINAGTNLHATIGTNHIPSRHYLRHQANTARPNFGRLDLGAYEFSPLEAWRQANFGTNATINLIAGDTADPNGNGIVNLLEYAYYQNPNGVISTGVPPSTIVSVTGTNYFGIRFARRVPPSELAYTVQVSTNLQHWTDGSRFSDTGDLIATPLTIAVGNTNTNSIVVRLQEPLTAAPRRFLRVLVHREP